MLRKATAILALLGSVIAIGGSQVVFAQETAPDPGASTEFCEVSGAGISGNQTITNSSYCKDVSNRFNSRGGDPVTDTNSPLLGKNSIIYRITQLVIMATGIVSVVMIIIGGFRYVTSAGDSNGTKGAKDTILYAVVGLIVALFAQVIVTFVLSKL